MSLLLDALKKSEAQRRRGQLPDMQTAAQDSAGSANRSRGGWRRLLVGLTIALLIALPVIAVLLAGGWLFGDRNVADRPLLTTGPEAVGEDVQRDSAAAEVADPVADPVAQNEPEPLPSRPAAEAEPVATIEPGPAIARSEAVAGRPAPGPPGEGSGPPPDEPDAGIESAPRTVPKSDAPERIAAVAGRATATAKDPALAAAADPVPVVGKAVEPTAQPAAGPAAGEDAAEPAAPPLQNFIRPWELPQNLRADFPELTMTVHYFAADPARRFVLINAERRVEGDPVADGVRLVEIVENGAVVEFRGYRILLR